MPSESPGGSERPAVVYEKSLIKPATLVGGLAIAGLVGASIAVFAKRRSESQESGPSSIYTSEKVPFVGWVSRADFEERAQNPRVIALVAEARAEAERIRNGLG